MAIKMKVLILDGDIHTLSKVYLALVHRSYKAEAFDNPGQLEARMKKFKPGLLIISREALNEVTVKLKLPMIVIEPEGVNSSSNVDGDVFYIGRPVSADQLMKMVSALTV